MKKSVLLCLAFATAVVALGSPVRAATTLQVGKSAQNSSAILPVDVGVESGIFVKHGLDIQIANLSGGGKLIQAMTAGSVDIGVSAGPEMELIAKGAPVLAVCNAAPPVAFMGITLPEDSPIKSVEQLKGKRIGVTSAVSLGSWLALELARQRGWGLDGVTVVAIGNTPSGIIAAFRTHAIDASINATALAFNMEANKQGRLLIPVSKYAGNISAGTIYATTHLIETNPDAVRNFLAGWLDTIDFMRKNKAETVKIESAITGYLPNVQANEYDLTIGMFSEDCVFDAESLANLKRSFIDLKLLPSPPDMSKLYTEALLPKR